MKQFLRYQISGSVFVGWLLILYLTSKPDFSQEMLFEFFRENTDLTLGGFISALPIGVLIHQLSVLLKNWIFAKWCQVLSDRPRRSYINSLNSKEKEKASYILDKISNLHSFYYVRFDNGLLAPALALYVSFFNSGFHIAEVKLAIASMLLISFLTVIYICSIIEELNFYDTELKLVTVKCEHSLKSEKTGSGFPCMCFLFVLVFYFVLFVLFVLYFDC